MEHDRRSARGRRTMGFRPPLDPAVALPVVPETKPGGTAACDAGRSCLPEGDALDHTRIECQNFADGAIRQRLAHRSGRVGLFCAQPRLHGVRRVLRLEELRATWFEVPDLGSCHAIASEMQALAPDEVTYPPLGSHMSCTALRNDLTGRAAGLMLYWGQTNPPCCTGLWHDDDRLNARVGGGYSRMPRSAPRARSASRSQAWTLHPIAKRSSSWRRVGNSPAGSIVFWPRRPRRLKQN